VWALKCYFPDAVSFLEIGCGTGYVLAGIKGAFPEMQLCGSEIYTTGLGFAAKRASNALLFQMDAREIPFKDEFDVIGAFDVLEHIDEDERVLQQLYRAVRPGGGIILTVPQHPFLWSQQDEAACHARRYRKHELKKKVEAAGFEVKMTTSFVSLLLPFMLLSRLRKRVPAEHYDPMMELKLGSRVNSVLESIMNIERALTQWGVRFPLGGSLLLVARKP
jgi:SAM-dependent methyltransferase